KIDLLGAYLEAERRIPDVKDAAKQLELQAKLDDVARALGPDAPDDDLVRARDTLNDLKIADAIRKQLEAEARALRKSIDEARGKAGESLAAALDAEVVPALDAIEAQLARGDVDGVHEKLDDARRLASVALTNALASRIASDSPAEDGARWRAMRDEV